MSEAAQKVAKTAKTQAKHAVSNAGEAVKLEVEDVAQTAIASIPFGTRHRNLLIAGAGVFGGIVLSEVGDRAIEKYRQRKYRKEGEAILRQATGA